MKGGLREIIKMLLFNTTVAFLFPLKHVAVAVVVVDVVFFAAVVTLLVAAAVVTVVVFAAIGTLLVAAAVVTFLVAVPVVQCNSSCCCYCCLCGSFLM